MKKRLFLFLLSAAAFSFPYVYTIVKLGKDSHLHVFPFWGIHLLFSLCCAAVLTLTALMIRRKKIRFLAVSVISVVLQLFILLESYKLCFTGKSFDDSFLLHFSLATLQRDVVVSVLPMLIAVGGCLLLTAALLSFVAYGISPLPKRKNRWLLLLPFFVAAFLPQSPTWLFVKMYTDVLAASESANTITLPPDPVLRENGIRPCDVTPLSLQAKPGKNLVFIVIESLEQNYLDSKQFPGLLPNIEKLLNGNDVLYFKNMRNEASNTFSFMYQSHMGCYIDCVNAADTADKLPSLSSILKKSGYQSCFIRACNLNFADTDLLLDKIGYDKAMDCTSPEVIAHVRERGAWGFRDYDLFPLAAGEYDRLSADGKPFLLTIFTVDSHAPRGVTGKKTIPYKGLDKEYSLLSALHTTDQALGKFIEHIRQSPQAKDTVIVITGDHLLMNDILSTGDEIRKRLSGRERKNLVTFVLNGREHGTVEAEGKPVDLAPILLWQMGVEHNYVFPNGFNVPQEQRPAKPQNALDTMLLRVYLAHKRGEKAVERRNALFAGPVSLKDEQGNCRLHLLPGREITLPQFSHFLKTGGLEINSRTQEPTWRFQYDYAEIGLFSTNVNDKNYFYLLACKPDSIIHTVLDIPKKDRFLLCTVQSGWVKYAASSDIRKLHLAHYELPENKIPAAEYDCTKTLAFLRYGDWRFPLFSRNDAFFDNDAIIMIPEKPEVFFRSHLNSKEQLQDLLRMFDEQLVDFTVWAKPDSPLHDRFSVPSKYRSQVMRLTVTPTGMKFDFFPFRPGDEYYVRKDKNDSFYCIRDSELDKAVKLESLSSCSKNCRGFCVVKIDKATGRIKKEYSGEDPEKIEALIASPDDSERLLLFVNKESDFLSRHFPDLVGKNVLFTVENRMIRHSIQYSNGEYQIPQGDAPVDRLWAVSVKPFFEGCLIRWGNTSFYVDGAELKQTFDGKGCHAIKLPCSMSKNPFSFNMTEKDYIRDMSCADDDHFFIALSRRDGALPALLDLPVKGEFLLAVKRSRAWETFWNDKIDFDVCGKR